MVGFCEELYFLEATGSQGTSRSKMVCRPCQLRVAFVVDLWLLREDPPSLVDEIYDSFGITLPLVEFHNITTRKAIHPTSNKTTDNAISENIESNASDGSSDDDSDWDDEELVETPKDQDEKKRNTFALEFADNQRSATEHHPYIVTRSGFSLP